MPTTPSQRTPRRPGRGTTACAAAWIAVALLFAAGRTARAQSTAHGAARCTEADTLVLAPSRDLYCIELFPRPEVPEATGVVALERPASPFGVAATPSGRLVYETALALSGLPPAESLGPYATYVAWAATPMLDRVVKLGEVGDGRTAAGRVVFNRFLVFVSAEPSADVESWTGPLVLRGMSPGMQMSDTHLMGLGGTAVTDRDPAAHGHERGGEHGHGWTPPPMNPRVSAMRLSGVDGAVPSVTPYLPGHAIDADTLPLARPRTVADLADGDTLHLAAGFVRRVIRGRAFVMYGFNGQYPGPLIRVEKDAEIVVVFRNAIEWPTSVHWHGIRIENRFDGVPGVTQDPVEPGETFVYRVRFPDAGIYWYHPHHREEIQQDLGLYGNMLVDSPDPDYYGPAHREEVLVLDDLLLGPTGLVPFGRERATHAVMGRFGNIMLVNGEPDYALEVDRGEVVRFFLTNASNVRTFNLSTGEAIGSAGANTGAASAPGGPERETSGVSPHAVRMKVVGADVGRFEREEWVESVVIAPAQRYTVDVRFDEPGEYALVNGVQAVDHVADRFVGAVDTLGTVRVADRAARPDLSASFDTLRSHADVVREVGRYRSHVERPPDRELILTLEDTGLPFALEQFMRSEATGYVHPMGWAGTMPRMDWLPTTAEARWVLREPSTGRENTDIRWRFEVDDAVKIRIHNERRSLHPMQHPIHLHGQRFLVLSTNGVPNENLAWKDTVLVPVGATVDILLELSNPGDWMLHCHIAEHLEAGMKTVFRVAADEATQ